MKIAVIDYKMSNMFSIRNALNSLGFNSEITADAKTILSSDGAVLPGVGSFPEAMRQLSDFGLVRVIQDYIASGKPFMGICLGLQLLFTKSDEFEECEGLGIIDGSVEGFVKYVPNKPVPHVGWNTVINKNTENCDKKRPLSKIKLEDSEYYYFVHSFFVKPSNNKVVLTTTRYGNFEFCSSIIFENVFACQFHPEKSGKKGIKIFDEFFRKE